MRCLWIIGILVILFVLFCLLRLGILIIFDGPPVRALVTVGPWKIQVAPSKSGKKTKRRGKKAEKPKKAEKSPAFLDRLKKLPRPTAEDLKTAWQQLMPPMKRTLRKIRRGIRIDPLEVSLTLAGKEDPAGTAELYGYAHAALWSVMPALEQMLVIPDPSIHIGLNFDAERTEIRGRVGIGLRIGTLLAVGFGMGIPALRWFLRYRKTHKTPKNSDNDKNDTQPGTEHRAA